MEDCLSKGFSSADCDNITMGNDDYNGHEFIYVSYDDASWILSNAFLILTMQTGFGMLEAGSVF